MAARHAWRADSIERLRRSFLDSPSLWRDMCFVEERGAMLAVRDENVIFHACVPVDAAGEPLDLLVDGKPQRGKALFTALDGVVRRAFRERRTSDLDVLYYLWAGPRSPLFGKDRMATFETYFVADKATHKETKNPYFELIHDKAFCKRIATELGGTGDVLIVNGHVPVKLEAGESPLKRSGMAVTIDGAANRLESRGAHAREDFPQRDDQNWMKHTLAWLDPETGKTRIDYRPVHTYTLTNDVAYIPPKARTY